jgi:hypothetical protein
MGLSPFVAPDAPPAIMGPAAAGRNHHLSGPGLAPGNQPSSCSAFRPQPERRASAEASVVDVDEVVAVPPLGWVLVGTDVVLDEVVELVALVEVVEPVEVVFADFADFPLVGGVVVVVVVLVELGAGVPKTCWAWPVCWSMAWMSDWNCDRSPAFKAAKALV